MSSDKYCTEAVTNVEYVFRKVWLEVSAKVCYPSDMWLFSRDGCDCRSQYGWSAMVTRTDWGSEVSSGSW